MTKDKLLKLANMVETSTLLDLASYNNLSIVLTGSADMSEHIERVFRGSLDAAKALHDVVLPGWRYMIDTSIKDMSAVCICDGWERILYVGTSEDPARAWVAAIIRAKAEEPK